MANNSTESEVDDLTSFRATADAIDKASVYICLVTGVPGNIFIFLTVRTFPASVACFHFKLLAVMDVTALCLQLTIRCVDWYDLASINTSYVGVGWKVYFNIAYFMSIYANWVLVYIATERLIFLRYPSQVHIYLTVPRAKANAILTAFLMASFCGIVIVKMDYFAIAWLVVYTTFYTAFPLGIVFLILWLLLGTMVERRQQKKVLQKEREKHNHHHHKESHKTTTGGPTSTDSGSHTTAGSNTSTGNQTPTMSKSTSGLSKHSGGALIAKHDSHASGQSAAATTNHYAMTLSFTANANKKLENITPEIETESEEILTRKAKEKKDIERCYTIMMLTLSFTFVILTVPYTVIEYIYVANNRELTDIFDEKQSWMYLLIIVALCLMYIEHSCNFYVFFLCSWRFRQQFIRVITRETSSPVQDGPSDSEQTKSFV